MEYPHFASVEDYAARFTAPAYWWTYVEVVCDRHGLGPIDDLKPGLPGTNPVFLVNRRYAVKLFTNLFGGAQSFSMEHEVYALLAQVGDFPAPRLVVQGHLFDEAVGWSWPYLVTTVIPGVSLGEVREAVTAEDEVAIVVYLGRLVRRLHHLPLTQRVDLPHTWTAFAQFIDERRPVCVAAQQQWAALPDHLIAQIQDYLLPTDALIPPASMPPRLLHCDLNADHLLGVFVNGRWQPTGILDFGDAKIGDPLYELVALHLYLFEGDPARLRLFLDSYGWDDTMRHHFVRRAMCYTLLFEFNAFAQPFQHWPHWRMVETLDELARLIWTL